MKILRISPQLLFTDANYEMSELRLIFVKFNLNRQRQLCGRHNIVNVCSGRFDNMNKPQHIVDTKVHLHAEVPLILGTDSE